MRKFVLALVSLTLLSCDKTAHLVPEKSVDAILIGGGIMSATLGTMLRELQPEISIEVFERMGAVAVESSDAWNNAGTGHSALCELNYTPEKEDGSVDIKKAIEINEAFEISKQFWAFEVQNKHIEASFINSTPHMSFVWGEQNVAYLKKRYDALKHHPLFRGMEYSEDHEQVKKWIPLVMEGREAKQKVAATRAETGTDVNFGALAKGLFEYLGRSEKTDIHVKHEVLDLKRGEDQMWTVVVRDLATDKVKSVRSKFVFIGAGGGALPLLEKSGIPEAKGFGGVPVGGQWLVSTNPEVIARHEAKVYGKAPVGSPPMSVPHLDTRMINGKKALLFGPFATFSTKFLKNGSWLDMPTAINLGNLRPMMEAGLDNIPLTNYLIRQLLLSPEQRMTALRDYFPNAKMEDWTLQDAGQRVQVVKNDPKLGGVLQFGTEIVSAKDGSLVALLGASPGASTAASIMVKVIEKSFAEDLKTAQWQSKMKAMIPSYGQSLSDNPRLADTVKRWDSDVLGLKYIGHQRLSQN